MRSLGLLGSFMCVVDSKGTEGKAVQCAMLKCNATACHRCGGVVWCVSGEEIFCQTENNLEIF